MFPMNIHQVKNKKTRNLLRGALSSKSEADAIRTIERLRRNSSAEDSLASFRFLRDSPLGQNLISGPAFPRKIDEIETVPLYDEGSLVVEIMTQRARLEKHEEELYDAIEIFGKLDLAIIERDSSRAAQLFTDAHSTFGISLFLMRKALSVKHSNLESKELTAAIQIVLAPFLKPRRQLLTVAFEDSIDKTIDHLRPRRYFLKLATNRKIPKKLLPLVCDMFSPYGSYGISESQVVQSYSRWSAIDAIFALYSSKKRADDAQDPKKALLIEKAIPPKVRAALDNSFEGFDLKLLNSLLCGEDARFSEHSFFFHAAAWQEIDAVRQYRINVERAIGPRLDGRFPVPKREASSFAPVVEDVSELLPEGQFDFEIQHIDPKSCGHLHRTIALIAAVETRNLEISDGETLLRLLDNTIDVSHLFSIDELRSFLPSRPSDNLFEYLRTAVFRDADNNSVTNHAFRRALQKTVLNDHQGNIVAFAESIDSEIKHVANHFYYLCTEYFLTELYILYSETDQIIDAQASLLDWFGTTRDDPDAVDRAKSHRLNLRLMRLRGKIDQTRLYVDPLRFVQWIQDNYGAELRGLYDVADDIVVDDSKATDLTDPVLSIQSPRLKLLSVLDGCFREFCTNRFNGIDSFIGRRVRHGSLHGQVVAEIKGDIEKAIVDFSTICPEFSDSVEKWFADYDNEVTECVAEHLHMKSDDKAEGWLHPTLIENDKINIANTMISQVGVALRDSPTVNDAIGIISEFCWIAAEVDLKRCRDMLEKLRRKYVLDVNEYACSDQLNVNQQVADRVRQLNAAVQHRFEVAIGWLTRPSTISPSASVTLLFQAVLDEITSRYPEYSPALKFLPGSDLDLIGHRFHFFYDALSILVDNAAKYGRNDGILEREILTWDELPSRRILQVSVTSQIEPHGTKSSKKRIEAAMSGEIGDAMIREGLSGLRKIRGLVTDVPEIEGFRHAFNNGSVTFTITMAYLIS